MSDCSEKRVQTTRLVVCSKRKREKKTRTTTTTENRHNQPKNVSPLYNYVTCKYRHMIYIAIEIQQFITTGKDSERENPPRVCVCVCVKIYIYLNSSLGCSCRGKARCPRSIIISIYRALPEDWTEIVHANEPRIPKLDVEDMVREKVCWINLICYTHTVGLSLAR